MADDHGCKREDFEKDNEYTVMTHGCNETCGSNQIKIMCGKNACFETLSATYVCNEDASKGDIYSVDVTEILKEDCDGQSECYFFQ